MNKMFDKMGGYLSFVADILAKQFVHLYLKVYE